MRAIHILVLAIASLLPQVTTAKCVVPVPDGGDVKPSAPNLHGRILRVDQSGLVVVSQAKSNKRVFVALPKDPEIYSVFGGDVAREDLAAGQTVWVWFEGCKWPTAGTPTSAYFQIYSRDPHDKP